MRWLDEYLHCTRVRLNDVKLLNNGRVMNYSILSMHEFNVHGNQRRRLILRRSMLRYTVYCICFFLTVDETTFLWYRNKTKDEPVKIFARTTSLYTACLMNGTQSVPLFTQVWPYGPWACLLSDAMQMRNVPTHSHPLYPRATAAA